MSENEEINEYLKPTKICDFDEPKVQDEARQIINNDNNPKDMAQKIFNFVRDKIAFGMDYLDAKASDTLNKKIGFCITKANLQVGLLRAVGIPARYHFVHLNSKVSTNIFPKFMSNLLGEVMTHPWAECHLSGRWIACDATMDESLIQGCIQNGLKEFSKEQIPTIDWDGENDLIIFNPWIVKDIGTYAALDSAISELTKKKDKGLPPKPPKILAAFLFFIINRHISRIRNT